MSDATFEEDTREASDLVIVTAGDVRVGVRVRRAAYRARNEHEVTFRFDRPNGQRTEWPKIIDDCWGNFYFYGWCDQAETQIIRWCLLDLGILRAYLSAMRRSTGDPSWLPSRPIPNRDGSGRFLAFNPSVIRICGDDLIKRHFIVGGLGYGQIEGPAVFVGVQPSRAAPRADQRPAINRQLGLWEHERVKGA